MIPIWAALNFHLLQSERFDFYLGPEIAYFWYLNDLSFDVPGVGTFGFATDNEFPNHDLPLDSTFVTIGVARR